MSSRPMSVRNLIRLDHRSEALIQTIGWDRTHVRSKNRKPSHAARRAFNSTKQVRGIASASEWRVRINSQRAIEPALQHVGIRQAADVAREFSPDETDDF